MYDRSRRFVTPRSVTGPYIAPTTYEPYKDHEVSGRPCLSSFMALGNRDSFLLKHANPPVGRYNVKHPKMTVHGCCTVRNQAKRYVWTQDRNPSPCRYDTTEIQVLSGRIKKTGRFEKKISFSKFKAPLPPLGHASIPATEDRFWTEDERTGKLVQMPPPNVDRTLGPAFYHVTEDFRVDRIKDSHWGNRTAFRKQIMSEAQGTHTIYDVRQRPLKKRQTARFLNNPRFMMAHIQQCYKDGYPGVGTYDVLLTEDPLQLRALLGPDEEPVPHAPFMQSEGLYPRIQRHLPPPGPGYYPFYSNLIIPSFNKNPPPFNMIVPRFQPTESLPMTDAVYDHTGIAEKMAVAVQRARSLRPGFNICSRRFPKPKKKDNRRMPGFLNPPERKFPPPSAAFNSKRDKHGSVIMTEGPNPTRYNVMESFKTSQGKKKPAPGYTAREHYEKGIGFWSSARCFQDKMIPEREIFPGPGTFDVSGNCLKDVGKFCFQSERFQEKLEITPGPGQYEVGPEIAENTVLGTHNASLANPQLYVRPKYFRVRPENIPISYLRTLSNARAESIKLQRRLDRWTEAVRHSKPVGTRTTPKPDQEVPPTFPDRPSTVSVQSKPRQKASAKMLLTSPNPTPDKI